ncbi:hypothetical protein NLG97_g1429 [Lecanicillium saksenae]|uniref:Uncharacterized protein n=1 Tax=Lecanicillium saksenae TaxID=468837 RepID=A0ACC1R7W5_9HYPO|nr:hypothetical protein NLG97_g1429 [Lecanicillium saksenae]
MAENTLSFPNESFFRRLIEVCHKYADRILVQDGLSNSIVHYGDLLSDVAYMRQKLFQVLPESIFDGKGIILPDAPYIFIIAPANYEYILASIAVFSLGGAIAPISSGLMPEEVCHLLRKARSRCILFSPQYEQIGEDIAREYSMWKQKDEYLSMIPIERSKMLCESISVEIDEDMILDPKAPGMLLFSSGSTGPPKGVVRPRISLQSLPPMADDGGIYLSFRPPHWISNAVGLLRVTLAATTVKVVRDAGDAIWSELRGGQVGLFLAPPDVFAALMRHFQESIEPLPALERDAFIAGVRKTPQIIVGGDVTWPTVLRFWQELLGRPLANAYGSSEVGVTTMTTNHVDDEGKAIHRCIGKPYLNVEVKLSEGDEGEILVKDAGMFTHYLADAEATKAAFDDDGYFKTGDIGRKCGDEYFVDGRVSRDMLRLRGKWISAHDVEALVVSLPYISEAYAVIASFQYRRQMSILVRAASTSTVTPTLEKIRADIQNDLEPFKLPTMFRLLKDHEEIPYTSSGKVDRRAIVGTYFGMADELSLPGGLEFTAKDSESRWERKMWDEVELTKWA